MPDAAILRLNFRKEMLQQEEAAQNQGQPARTGYCRSLLRNRRLASILRRRSGKPNPRRKFARPLSLTSRCWVAPKKSAMRQDKIAAEGARHVQQLEKKLTEASTFLNGWRNGKSLVSKS